MKRIGKTCCGTKIWLFCWKLVFYFCRIKINWSITQNIVFVGDFKWKYVTIRNEFLTNLITPKLRKLLLKNQSHYFGKKNRRMWIFLIYSSLEHFITFIITHIHILMPEWVHTCIFPSFIIIINLKLLFFTNDRNVSA